MKNLPVQNVRLNGRVLNFMGRLQHPSVHCCQQYKVEASDEITQSVQRKAEQKIFIPHYKVERRVPGFLRVTISM